MEVVVHERLFQTEKTKAIVNAEVLLLMLVFSYKPTEDGYLASFKERLVVRSDLQELLEDTYTATLAIRNFRAMIAIANDFDLEMRQYDVSTALDNARINRKQYVEVLDALQGKYRRYFRGPTRSLWS
ncbi:hypothetical protein K3495_g6192 [Podosphaera aphanis]|nr:hypothetical protein K3495_g6192 [Podosphaera aphanis]